MAENAAPTRRYVVLRTDEENLLEQLGFVDARDAHHAARLVVEGDPALIAQDGKTLSFIAIPERTWTANRSTVEVQHEFHVRTVPPTVTP